MFLHKYLSKNNKIPFFIDPENTQNIEGSAQFSDALCQSIYWILAALGIISIILIYLFRRIIRTNYLLKTKIIGINKKAFWFTFGILILLYIITRSFLIVISKFENQWESIPLHFCRLMLLFISFCLIFNRLNWIKYYGHLALLGTLLALFIPGFNHNNGVDNFWYWDYLFAHILILILITIMFSITTFEYSFQNTIETIIFFWILTIIIWTFNLISTDYISVPGWKSNYFYLGKDEYNDMYKVVGVLLKWPYNIITVPLTGIIILTLTIVIWFWLDKFHIDKKDNKIVFYVTKSQMWNFYKTTFKTCFKKKKEVITTDNNLTKKQENQNDLNR